MTSKSTVASPALKASANTSCETEAASATAGRSSDWFILVSSSSMFSTCISSRFDDSDY